MALTAKVGSNSQQEFDPVPQGTHVARCVRVIDQGTQKRVYKGDEKLRHQVWIMWELPMIERTWTDGDGKEQSGPAAVSEFMTLSLAPNAALRGLLESWRGKGFTEEEVTAGVDLGTLLDKPCLLSVTHNPKQDGRMWVNVTGCMGLPAGMTCPDRIGELQYLELTPEGFDPEMFDRLSERMRARIMQSPEYKAVSNPGMQPAATSTQPESPKADAIPYDDTPPPDDDCPF